jgi:hypothetical protein
LRANAVKSEFGLMAHPAAHKSSNSAAQLALRPIN